MEIIMKILFGSIFVIIGIALIVARKIKKNKCTEITTGIVVDIVKGAKSGDLMRALHPVFKYTAGSETVTITSQYGGRPCRFNVGDEVEIHYNPSNPRDFFAPGDKTDYTLSAIFIIGGIVFTTIFVLF